MTTRQKIFLGGLGALTPVVLNLLAVDLKTTFETIGVFVFAGYALRVVGLFYLGGLVAYLHKDENKPIKLFELGIVAPALLTTLLSAAQIEAPKTEKAVADNHSAALQLMPVVYAQSSDPDQFKRFTLPREGAASQVWRGLTGSKIANVWFVIVESFQKPADAQKEAAAINQRQRNFKAEVFAPYDDNQGYSVVIGANLTYEEANAQQQSAAKSGLKASLWTFPKR